MRELYFETMRWAIERYFGWNRQQQEESFSLWFKPNEARIITADGADGADAGWIQQRQDAGEVFLGSIYVTPAMQGKGIGASIIQDLLIYMRADPKTGGGRHVPGDQACA